MSEKTEIELYAELSRDMAQAYAKEWLRTHNTAPSSISEDEAERTVGMWLFLEKKRMSVVEAIEFGEDKLIKAKRIKPVPSIDVADLLS